MRNHDRTTPDNVPSSPPPSSSHYLPSDGLRSSPIRPSRARKERRMPSVTPRRLGRFFTPRSSLPSVQSLPGRRILGNLDDAAVNRQVLSSPGEGFSSDILMSSPTDRHCGTRAGVRGRKRAAQDFPESVIKRRGLVPEDVELPRLDLGILDRTRLTPQDASMLDVTSQFSDENLSERRKATLTQFFKASRGQVQFSKLDLSTQPVESLPQSPTESQTLEDYQPKPIRKFRNRGHAAQLLNREHGFGRRPDEEALTRPVADARGQCSAFHSNEGDLYQCSNYDANGSTNVFSQASAHSAPVTAIGDEQGYVRLFNTSSGGTTKVDFHFKVHDNAVMDLAFSDDDLRLATACGDKTGKVVDVATQTTAVELEGGHEDSLRQIAFQPGQSNGSVLATSDKAGRIRIWDLRCPSVPVGSFSERVTTGTILRTLQSPPGQAQSTNCISLAHSRTVHGVTSVASVPAIQWFPGGRSHLLLSASEANAAIKLWDTRYIKPRRQADDVPLATTTQPRTHAWRSYGITSLSLSSDAARLYAVCRDSVVYAYSTAHLILGTSTDLAINGAHKHRPTGADGLGPLYGLKHDALRVNSFYVKSAIRKATANSPELLAVGSSESSPILFPTDERYMMSSFSRNAHVLPDPSGTAARTPYSRAQSSATQTPTPLLPVYSSGTALVEGHTREVTTLSWSNEGKLVTASDDYIVRHWQEDEGRARHLRQVGYGGGERYMCGWADVGADWDQDDDE